MRPRSCAVRRDGSRRLRCNTVTTGGVILVEALRRRGVDTVFGLPGVQLDGLFDALAQRREISVVHTRHEQATAYMADGYARATGRVGVCAVVPGPGVLNAGAGMATAYANHSQVLLVAGHLFGGDRARGTGALHEIPDQSAVIEGTIGATNRIRSVDDIGPALQAAFERLDGRPPRPAAIEIGPDVLLAGTDMAVPEPTPLPKRPGVDSTAVERAAVALAGSQRPMIVAGGGARQAGAGLRALSVALAAPVVLTAEGKGAVAADLPGTVPHAAAFPLLEEADAVVVVGSRFDPGSGPVRRDPLPAIVRIDLDEAQLERHAQTGGEAIAILAGADEGSAALARAIAGLRPADTERDALHRARVDEIRTALLRGLAEHFPDTWSYCRALRAAIPPDGILVDEMTQVGYMARNAYPAAEGRTYIGSGYQGTLGFGYATALGAKVGRPDSVVVSISGDGGFLYTAAELATAVHHRIAVVAVVFVDDAYGNVKGIQQRVYGREIASTLTNPDLVRLAESFGVRGARVEGPEDLRAAVATAVERDEPAVIAVPIGPQPDIMSVLTGRFRL